LAKYKIFGYPPIYINLIMIADVEVRLAILADAADIAAMSRDYIEQGLPWGWRHDRVAKAINDPETNVAVVGGQGSLVAFGIMSYSEDEAHLQLFAVRRASRRKGIGSAVLLWLEAVARSAGAKRIRVEARIDNSAARCFYNEHGYHERHIGEAMYSGIIDGVCLEKWLRNDDAHPATRSKQ
jgi:ribosomal-protein-alanine N-acetyltransferase